MKGKHILVTGAARGIGKGIAESFLAEGGKVCLLDQRAEDLQRTVTDLQSLGTVDSIVCDLRSSSDLRAAAQQAWDRWGGLDILVNNAGVAVREAFVDIPEDRWHKIMNVNVSAMFLLSQWVAKKMIETNREGAIVNMASKNGLAGSSKLAHYNTSKGGVLLLTQSMAVELAKYGIRVNAVAPGFIETPLDRELKQKEESPLHLTKRTPMKRLGTVEEVANAILFLASEKASYITGTTLVVDGGHLANAGEL